MIKKTFNMQMMKEVKFDVNYALDKDYPMEEDKYGNLIIPEADTVTVHMHIVFKEDMAELYISVNDCEYEDYCCGLPYYQHDLDVETYGYSERYYTHQEIIGLMYRYVMNNYIVEGYMEDYHVEEFD